MFLQPLIPKAMQTWGKITAAFWNNVLGAFEIQLSVRSRCPKTSGTSAVIKEERKRDLSWVWTDSLCSVVVSVSFCLSFSEGFWYCSSTWLKHQCCLWGSATSASLHQTGTQHWWELHPMDRAPISPLQSSSATGCLQYHPKSPGQSEPQTTNKSWCKIVK